MVFVVTLLCLFLGWKNAVFATIGIPVSLLITFIFLQMAGLSLNTSSLFGLMMVIGIIVDDAIVIIENCYRYMNRGKSPREAAIQGTNEVLAPVFYGLSHHHRGISAADAASRDYGKIYARGTHGGVSGTFGIAFRSILYSPGAYRGLER